MTLPQVYELTDYWEKSPPLHLLIGAWLAPRGGRRGEGNARAAGEIGSLLARAPNGICRWDALTPNGEG